MRSPSNNPFLPGADRVPDVWAGRGLEIADFSGIVRPRRLAGLHERGRAVLGEFGIGKSALVNRIADDAAAAGDWVPARVRAARGADVLQLLTESLAAFVRQRSADARPGRAGGGLLRRLEEVTLPVVGGGVRLRADAPAPNAYRGVHDALVELAALAGEEGRLLLVRIDEIQNVTSPEALSQLLTVLGDALEATATRVGAGGIRREDALPLAVYVSGLPDFHDLAAAAGATFSRRFRTLELEPLEDADLREALRPFTTDGWPVLGEDGEARVVLDVEAADLLVEVPVGDPFLFQLAGEAAWNAGAGPVITGEEARRGWQSARREVERYVGSRLRGLSDLQLEVLRAAAALPADRRASGEVARAVGRRSSAEIASTTRSLDVEHRLIRREAGRIVFRSPAVEAYLAGGWP
jgi:hypothetical protein